MTAVAPGRRRTRAEQVEDALWAVAVVALCVAGLWLTCVLAWSAGGAL